MIELRYNGCPECLNSAQTVLRSIGFFRGRDFKVVHHSDHRSDKIYAARPDYIEIFSGAILYNPDTGHWLDFYSNNHERMVLKAKTESDRKHLKDLVLALISGQ